ncbi:MAG: hypothetical protein FMNOHCHN_01977 [Ignavibacteriaceae bacterium]|nr:hypothetical protein [Ignavibacteriaceae bacterium]
MKEKAGISLLIAKICLTFTILTAAPLTGQEFYNWKNYTDKKVVRSAGVSGDLIWAATSGGLFYYNTVTTSFFTLDKADGLSGSNLNSLAIDADGKVWMGSLTGILEIYNPATKTTKRISDIANSNFPNKRINSITVRGDTVFVSTEFGLSLIDARNYVFFDTFFKFASLNANSRIYSSYRDSLIYAGSDFGLIGQKPGSTNLAAPSSWSVYTTADGLQSNNVYKAGSYQGRLIVSTSRGFSVRNGAAWSSLIPSLNTTPVTDFAVRGDSLFYIAANSLWLYNGSTSTEIYSPSPGTLSSLTLSVSGDIVLTSDRGVILITATRTVTGIYPPGPGSNQFLDLAVDNNGTLWAATGRDITGKGLYRFDGFSWSILDLSADPSIGSNSYFSVTTGSDNTLYAGNWGKGFLRIKPDGTRTLFNAQTTPIRGIANDVDFIVIPAVKQDSRGNLWVLNHDAADRKILSALTPDSTWHQYANPADSSISQYMSMVIDRNDTKWYISADAQKSGLFFFNENKTFGVKSDDKYGYASSASELQGKTINAMAIDRRGEIWLGTNLGTFVIANPSTVLNTNSTVRVTSLFSLRQYTVTAIAVDPINRKWIGTNNQGVLVFSPDGSTLIAAFDSRNSPLLSDAVQSIAFDERTGTAYIGTDAGLTSVATLAAKPERDLSGLTVYPSPFLLGTPGKTLTIDGLVQDAEIKIIDISGNVIREFSSPGGRIAQWDGRDKSGALVNSGVYIITASDQEGNTVGSVKAAVVRK